MTDLLAARSQMALSLAFHILFAVAGMGMPLLMAIAEAAWLRTGDDLYREVAKRWAKGTAILFAVGAVTGTVLSFELGLLWPGFMRFAGPILAMPFSMEGFAFFFEAIFLGVYLYGWDRVPRLAHWGAGVGVLLSGVASAAFVVCANAWMNNPTGYVVEPDGSLTIDPVAAMFNPGATGEVLHMVMAAFVSIGFLGAGIHAWYLLRDEANLFHRRGHAIATLVAVTAALAQPLTGHVIAEHTAHAQPAKLAAAEAQWADETWAPVRIGGWPDVANERTDYAIEVPGLLSVLAFGDPEAMVTGLSRVPPEDRPNVVVVHAAYQVMLGLAMAMAGVAVVAGALWAKRRHAPRDRLLLWAQVLLAPAGLIAVEAGWTVTEVGRQPWVIQGVMRTSHAVTPVTGISASLVIYAAMYALLGVATLALLRQQFAAAPVVHPHDDGGAA